MAWSCSRVGVRIYGERFRINLPVTIPVPFLPLRMRSAPPPRLRLHTSGLPMASDVDLRQIAESCHGYSGADLAALAREAAMHALTEAAQEILARPWGGGREGGPPFAGRREGAICSEDLPGGGVSGADYTLNAAQPLPSPPLPAAVSASDFLAAMRRVGPSIVRGAEVEVRPVLWDNVGGLPEVKRRLRQAVEWPLLHRDAFDRLGLKPPRGVLLFGPPGER